MEGIRGLLETSLYYPHADHEAVLGFYEKTLKLHGVASWDSGRAYRVGTSVLLLFDLDLLADNQGPVSDHGSSGPGHVCLIAEVGRYEDLRERIAAAGIEITHDHDWSAGKRSFYFKDPVGNLLEIANTDLWPA